MVNQHAPVTLFYSYSSVDKDLRKLLERHLALLRNQGVIADWHDRQIEPGTEWEGQIHEHLNSAQVILLLVSADFLASDYCYKIEMTRALERHHAGETRVIPVILRPCDWRNAPFAALQALPTDGKAVVTWEHIDEAFTDVAKGIRQAANELSDGAVGSANGLVFPVVGGERTRVVAKGLLSYEAEDARFFLQLLPPPWDRGLPRCVRFWKDRIDQRDPERTFAIGLLFGPSGCGKSSLVKAALIPHLDEAAVLPIYLETTPDDTETRLLKALRKNLPGLPTDVTLDAALQTVAAGSLTEHKVLLVLDQFEQWLHAHRAEQDTPLVRALRVCDGANLQCVLMIRPEFQLAAWRLFDELGVEWTKDRNVNLADLFDPPHARAVLAEFGRSYGRLPDHADSMSADQEEFLDQVVAALADQDGRIVAVRLALFAEMVKGRPWVPKTLRDVGGAAGVGREFLEENFSRDTAPYRRYKSAASRVLQALLPDVGTDIRGQWQPETSLRQAANLSDTDFERLMKILVGELKLVKPTDPKQDEDFGASPSSADQAVASPASERYYQLTHDYLVPSLRAWLTSELQKTWWGRALLRLEERTAQWQHSRDRRFLPGPLELLQILAGVPWTRYEPAQRSMIRAAGVRYGKLAAVVLVILCAAGLGWREWSLRDRAGQVVPALFGKTPEQFGQTCEGELRRCRHWAIALLTEYCQPAPYDPQAEDRQRINNGKVSADAAIALWRLGQPDAACQALRVDADPESMTQFVDRCKDRGIAADALWDQLKKTPKTKPADVSVRYGLLLALGEFQLEGIPQEQREEWAGELATWYGNDPSSAIHSASGWLLRQWGHADAVDAVDHTAKPYDAGWEWFVEEVKHNDGGGPDYFTFIVFGPKPGERPVEFLMSSPENESGRSADETCHKVQLTRRFAICDREMANAQFWRFRPERKASGAPKSAASAPDHPAERITWYDAVDYCRWLGKELKLSEAEQCYFIEEKSSAAETRDKRSAKSSESKWQFDPLRRGFRLPTEAEWEYACRAGTLTAFSTGSDDQPQRLGKYARFNQVNSGPCAALRPNLRGLFDMHGNVWEWCDDQSQEAWPADSARVLRGGSCGNDPTNCRSAIRDYIDPTWSYNYFVGFRLARALPENLDHLPSLAERERAK